MSSVGSGCTAADRWLMYFVQRGIAAPSRTTRTTPVPTLCRWRCPGLASARVVAKRRCWPHEESGEGEEEAAARWPAPCSDRSACRSRRPVRRLSASSALGGASRTVSSASASVVRAGARASAATVSAATDLRGGGTGSQRRNRVWTFDSWLDPTRMLLTRWPDPVTECALNWEIILMTMCY